MRVFQMIPMTIVSLVMFNVLAFGPGADGQIWSQTVFEVNMLSNVLWKPNYADLTLFVALIMLFFELLKATRFGSSTIVDHLLSMVVFVIYLVEFLLIDFSAPQEIENLVQGTSVLFLLMIIALLDVVAGFSISIRTAQRDVAFAPGTGMNGG